jgi:hypothetical protein
MKMDPKGQYTLRVRRGSEVDKVLQLCTNGQHHSRDEIVEAAGLSRSYPMAKVWLAQWFDNVSCDRRSGASDHDIQLHYIDIKPAVVQSIQNAEFTVEGAGQADSSEVGEIIWPDAPPMIERMDNFRTPGFYKTMKAMVALGKHISVEGPPGIGKSTSVEQLACESGIPLVSVGGEAGLRKRDLVGTQEIHNGTSKFVVAEFAAAVVNGWWAKIDEVNAADPDVIMLLNAVMSAPYVINIHGKQYPVHPRFRLFVTYNHGLVGTKPLPQAFKDRFFPVKVTFPSESQLRKILEAHGMPSKTELFANWTDGIVKFGIQMWDAHVRGQVRYQISPRRLIDAVCLMTNGIVSDVKDALKMAVVNAIDNPLEAKVADRIVGGLN